MITDSEDSRTPTSPTTTTASATTTSTKEATQAQVHLDVDVSPPDEEQLEAKTSTTQSQTHEQSRASFDISQIPTYDVPPPDKWLNPDDAPYHQFKQLQPNQQPQCTSDEESMDDDGSSPDDDQKPDVKDEGAAERAESKVGLPPQPRWVPQEYFMRRRRTAPGEFIKPVEVEFEERMKRKPLATDNDEISTNKVAVPPANIVQLKGSSLPPHLCWLRLRRKWLLKNFLKHLIGTSNIRYMRETFASICHHQTTAWDCHSLCWQCYLEFGLPLCGLDVELDCPHCKIMGRKATQARNYLLRAGKAELDRIAAEDQAFKEAKEMGHEPPKRSTAKSVFRKYKPRGGLPHNVYTQEDADQWIFAKNLRDAEPGLAGGE